VPIASTSHQFRHNMYQRRNRLFTLEEIALHNRFAAIAVQTSDTEKTYEQYRALLTECQQRGMRPCPFQHFCSLVNAFQLHRIHTSGARKWWPEPVCLPGNARPANLKELLSSLDRASMEG